MPTYDYRCKKGHRYERREPFRSSTTHDCEKCGAEATRVLNAPAISFKGSGWYKIDSRGDEPRTSKADSETKSDSAKKSGSSDSSSSSKSDSSSNGSSGDSSSKSSSGDSSSKSEKAKSSKAD